MGVNVRLGSCVGVSGVIQHGTDGVDTAELLAPPATSDRCDEFDEG